MTTPLTIPRLEMAMTEGVIAEWLVPDGAQVKEGDPNYSIETGKSIQEIQSPVAGRLTQKAQPGETYQVGTEIGEIV